MPSNPASGVDGFVLSIPKVVITTNEQPNWRFCGAQPNDVFVASMLGTVVLVTVLFGNIMKKY
jgi:hypothetical protein